MIRLALAAVVAAAAPALPGAKAVKVCAAAGPFWPTMTLAVTGSTAWVACKEQSRVIRVATKTGKTQKSVRLSSPAIAVGSAYGSVWALDSASTLYRIAPASGKVTRRTSVGARAAYNLWAGGGSMWVADDQGAAVIRIAPSTGKVVATVPVGDGPADIVFDASAAWVIDHRDRTLVRIDLATNKPTQIGTIGEENTAPERMVLAGGSLWITGRGADLLKVNPSTGAVQQTVEIGASGIDVVALGETLWVPTRSAAVDPTGFPTRDALRRVSVSTGAVSTVSTATARIDVHGLDARGGAVWIADNRSGRLYRIGA